MKSISKFLFFVLLLIGLSAGIPVTLISSWPLDRRTPTEMHDRLHFDINEARFAAARYRATILVFSLGEPHSYLRVVTATEFADFVLPAGSQISLDVKRYVGMIGTPPAGGSAEDYRSLSRKLYQTLLRPAEHLLKGRRLLVVPDGSLSLLPFETLIRDAPSSTAEGAHFIDQEFTFSYAPSVPEFLSNVKLSHRSSAPTKGILVYADPVYSGSFPRLMSTRAEAMSIQELFPSQTVVRLGADATKQSITEGSLSDYRIIHFATHGIINEDSRKSGVVLSQGYNSNADGLLTADDVANLKISAALVVLSACETGGATDGSLGLANAFLKAGVREVVTSLWQVNDFGAADFMKMYYLRMQHGESPSDALRSAKLEMMRSRIPYAHPYYWAPFIHVGEF